MSSHKLFGQFIPWPVGIRCLGGPCSGGYFYGRTRNHKEQFLALLLHLAPARCIGAPAKTRNAWRRDVSWPRRSAVPPLTCSWRLYKLC